MADLAKLVVRLEAETAKYQAELEKAKRQLGKFDSDASALVKRIGATVATAAVAAATAFAAMGKAAIDSADKLNKLSQSTGVSVESLSQLKYVAELSDVSLEDLSTSLARLSRTAEGAAQGQKSQAEAFARLGISATDAKGQLKGTEELLLDIAEQFSQYQDGAAKAALAQDLFGRSGANLIPFLNQGRDGIEALKREADALGLTLSAEAAQAAEEFNDNLTRLKAVTQGIVNQLVQEMLPTLQAFSANAVDSAARSESLRAAVALLGGAFKVFVSAGVAVVSTFQQIGQAIYTLNVSQFHLLRGEFKLAAEEFTTGFAKIRDNVVGDAETIGRIWGKTVNEVVEGAEKVGGAPKKILGVGVSAESIAEVTVNARKIELSATEQFYQQLGEMTKTAEDQAVSSYYRQQVALQELYTQGRVSLDDYNTRLRATLDEVLPEVEVTAKKITKVVQEQTEVLTEFQLEAARRTQNIIADALTGGFEDGIKGVLRAVAQMLVDITAQIVAADLAKRLFGDMTLSGGMSGGWFGKLLSTGLGMLSGLGGGEAAVAGAAGATFSGPRDSGGRGYPGMAYAIGTKAQPELFVPDTAGEFYPAGEWGNTVNNYFTIQAPVGTVSRQTQAQIAAAAARGAADASRRNN